MVEQCEQPQMRTALDAGVNLEADSLSQGGSISRGAKEINLRNT